MKSQRSGRRRTARGSRRSCDQPKQRIGKRTERLARANERLKIEIARCKRTEALLNGRKRVLELVASGAHLQTSMEALTKLIERLTPGMLCSVLLLDDDGLRLRHCAAPSLPAAYRKVIDGLKIGPRAGSCGTAASRKAAVYVDDIATDRLWTHYRAAALTHGLHSCWSTPIFDSDRRVLGTFAMYYRQPGRPTPEHIRLVEIATHVASIAICRDRYETALRDREAKLKEAQRLANLGYWERELRTNRIAWSESTHRIFGRPDCGPILSQAGLQQMIHPDDRQIQSAAFKAALRGGPLYDVEYRIIRPDGEVRFLHVRDEIIHDASGKPVRMFGTVQDITERKLAEARLHAQQQEIRAVVENSPDLIARFDTERRRTYVNPALVRASGLSEAALLDREIASAAKQGAVHATEEEISVLDRALKHVLKTSKPLDLQTTWPIQTGRRTFAVRLEPEFDDKGHLDSVLVISRDVTDLKESEKQLRQAQARLELILATLPVGVAVTNRNGDIVMTNATSRRIWGDIIASGTERWERSKGFWHDSGKRVSPEDWASVRALSEGQTSLNELIDIETYDGELKIIQNSSAPIRNAEGLIVGAVIVNEDVTERVRGEERLHQAQSELARAARVTMMGELTASIAHEVNQPLAALVTNANACLEWLGASPPNTGEVRKAVQRIVRDGTRAAEVIARVRALLKKGEPARGPVDLNQVIREAVALVRIEIKRKAVSLQIELAPELPRVLADAVQIQQVMLNLIGNALDSLAAVEEHRRRLRILTELSDKRDALVSVQDTGIGIDPGNEGKLFDPFFTTKSHGLGMGLAISRSIIEAHGGRLWTTHNPEAGVTFNFILPVQNGTHS